MNNANNRLPNAIELSEIYVKNNKVCEHESKIYAFDDKLKYYIKVDPDIISTFMRNHLDKQYVDKIRRARYVETYKFVRGGYSHKTLKQTIPVFGRELKPYPDMYKIPPIERTKHWKYRREQLTTEALAEIILSNYRVAVHDSSLYIFNDTTPTEYFEKATLGIVCKCLLKTMDSRDFKLVDESHYKRVYQYLTTYHNEYVECTIPVIARGIVVE